MWIWGLEFGDLDLWIGFWSSMTLVRQGRNSPSVNQSHWRGFRSIETTTSHETLGIRDLWWNVYAFHKDINIWRTAKDTAWPGQTGSIYLISWPQLQRLFLGSSPSSPQPWAQEWSLLRASEAVCGAAQGNRGTLQGNREGRGDGGKIVSRWSLRLSRLPRLGCLRQNSALCPVCTQHRLSSNLAGRAFSGLEWGCGFLLFQLDRFPIRFIKRLCEFLCKWGEQDEEFIPC